MMLKKLISSWYLHVANNESLRYLFKLRKLCEASSLSLTALTISVFPCDWAKRSDEDDEDGDHAELRTTCS